MARPRICEVVAHSPVDEWTVERGGTAIRGYDCDRPATMFMYQTKGQEHPVCDEHGQAWLAHEPFWKVRYPPLPQAEVDAAVNSILAVLKKEAP